MKDNTKNEIGLKDSAKTYRKGGWGQYTDFAGSLDESTPTEAEDLKTAKEWIEKVAKVNNPDLEFKAQKVYPDGFYRIYYRSKAQ